MSSSSQYIDRKTVNASYRPKAGAMSPGLKRARAPYRVRNAVTGLVLGAFATGVWAYSISAVKQDVFDDVDEEARAMARTGTLNEALKREEDAQAPAVVQPIQAQAMAWTGTVNEASKGEEDARAPAVVQQASPIAAESMSIPSPTPSTTSRQYRGLLQRLDSRFPRMLDPTNKTLVWGAPPVDNVGKIGRS